MQSNLKALLPRFNAYEWKSSCKCYSTLGFWSLNSCALCYMQFVLISQIARFMGTIWCPPGADMLAPGTLLLGLRPHYISWFHHAAGCFAVIFWKRYICLVRSRWSIWKMSPANWNQPQTDTCTKIAICTGVSGRLASIKYYDIGKFAYRKCPYCFKRLMISCICLNYYNIQRLYGKERCRLLLENSTLK